MKLIKLSADHYIIVDDSEIKEKSGDWFYSFETGNVNIRYCKYDTLIYNTTISCKKITHSTQPLDIDIHGFKYWGTNIIPLELSEVKELLGEIDAVKKANEYANNETPDLDNDYLIGVFQGQIDGYISGYNQALEDNKDKIYTEDDIIEIFNLYDKHIQINMQPNGKIQSPIDFIQSFQSKTSWGVEFVNDKIKLI